MIPSFGARYFSGEGEVPQKSEAWDRTKIESVDSGFAHPFLIWKCILLVRKFNTNLIPLIKTQCLTPFFASSSRPCCASHWVWDAMNHHLESMPLQIKHPLRSPRGRRMRRANRHGSQNSIGRIRQCLLMARASAM